MISVSIWLRDQSACDIPGSTRGISESYDTNSLLCLCQQWLPASSMASLAINATPISSRSSTKLVCTVSAVSWSVSFSHVRSLDGRVHFHTGLRWLVLYSVAITGCVITEVLLFWGWVTVSDVELVALDVWSRSNNIRAKSEYETVPELVNRQKDHEMKASSTNPLKNANSLGNRENWPDLLHNLGQIRMVWSSDLQRSSKDFRSTSHRPWMSLPRRKFWLQQECAP
jgi:hypothetical protein